MCNGRPDPSLRPPQFAIVTAVLDNCRAIGEVLRYFVEALVRMRAGGVSDGSLGGLLRRSREDLAAMCRCGVGGVESRLCKKVRKVPLFLCRAA